MGPLVSTNPELNPKRKGRRFGCKPEGDSNPCLNEHWFMSLGQALETIETWRLDYNAVRPHSALGDVPPQELEQLTLNRATAPILSS